MISRSAFVLLSCCTAAIMFFSSTISAETAKTQRMNVAVLNLKHSGGVSADEAEIITDRLRSELFNTGNVNIMEREQMSALLKEEQFQSSGMTDSALVEMGKKLGVQQIVAGSIGKVGTIYLVNLRVIDIRTAQIIKAVSRDLNGLEIVVSNLGKVANDLFPGEGQAALGKGSSMSSVASEVAPSSQGSSDLSSSRQAQEKPRPSVGRQEESGSAGSGKSRFGISIGSSFLFGQPDLTMNIYDTSMSIKDMYETATYTSAVLPAIELKYAIGGIEGTGLFTTIVAGLSLGGWGETFTNTNVWNEFQSTYVDETEEMIFGTACFYIGADIGAKMGALRPSIGLQIGSQGLSGEDNYSMTETISGINLDQDYTATITGRTTSIGISAGIEYMLSTNLGLDCNVVFHRAVFKDAEFKIEGYTGAAKVTAESPAAGLDLNLSYYF